MILACVSQTQRLYDVVSETNVDMQKEVFLFVEGFSFHESFIVVLAWVDNCRRLIEYNINNNHRLKRLKETLNLEFPHYCSVKGMKPNLLAVIKAYEDDMKPSRRIVYFKREEMVTETEGKIGDTYV